MFSQLSFLIPFLVLVSTNAQDFTIPPQWRKPTLSTFVSSRRAIAKSVIDSVLPHFNATSGLIDSAATILYLIIAESIWDTVNAYFVTPEDASAGEHPLKDKQIASTCNGATTAGAVFFSADKTSTGVNGETVCAFMALSAYLYEATNQDQYHNAATLSAEFIKAHLYNGAIIIDSIALSDCAVVAEAVTYNSGFFIDGLSVYANYTNNSDWSTFLGDLITSTDKEKDALTNSFGQALKAIFIRGLHVAWSRSPPGSDVAKLIEAFVLVQYNALMDWASYPGTNEFSPRWLGPASSDHLPWGQAAAIDVPQRCYFEDDAGPRSDSTGSVTMHQSQTVSASTSPDNFTSGAKSTNIGLIAGLSVAGVVFACIVLRAVPFPYATEEEREPKWAPGSPSSPLHRQGDIRPFLLSNNMSTPTSEKSRADSRAPGGSSPLIESHLDRPNSFGTETVPRQGATSHDPDTETTRGTVGSVSHLQSNTTSRERERGGNRSGRAAGHVRGGAEPWMIPRLVRKLNRALAMLPAPARSEQGGTEHPPEYQNIAPSSR
ncbi:hypothetical protein NLI96_g1197 [Meripilus lineatus]|uniref:Glycoside hydrolase family 76 protein n=1 Tax=Meripilus lineatus TaxID=2056292 RepID=A0AAD5YHS0_9APHY|nr:hypothetical protein NLI96_g1197 [Physisporinus lineatus]